MGVDRKILDRADLLTSRAQARHDGRRVVQCHGCFDIVHPGHVRHLRFAKAQGDVLLVSITGDSEVGKGQGRPLIPQELRAENLAELDCVDWVYIEPSATAASLLADVQPDVYVKGREYEHNDDPRFRDERLAVEAAGGRVLFSSGDVVFSSTALIATMEQSVDPFHKQLAHLTARPGLGVAPLRELISRFARQRIVVVGESILDSYVLCDQPDVAGESPVLTLRPVQRREYEGGAAIIAQHASSMGARTELVTMLPEGEVGEGFRRRLEAAGVRVHALSVPGPMPEKQRYLVGAQKLMKVDLVSAITLDARQRARFAELVGEAVGDGCDAGVIADFGLGLIAPPELGRLCRTLRQGARVLVGDVSGRRSSLRSMRDLDLILPSERELRDAYRQYDEGLPSLAWRMIEETRSGAAIVTMGADGLVTFSRIAGTDANESGAWKRRLSSEHVPAICPFAADALGCGDALQTAATLSLASGGSLDAAAFLGAVAAGVEAQRLGNIPVSASDLRQGVARVHSAHLAYASAEVIAPRPGNTTEERRARAS